MFKNLKSFIERKFKYYQRLYFYYNLYKKNKGTQTFNEFLNERKGTLTCYSCFKVSKNSELVSAEKGSGNNACPNCKKTTFITTGL